MGSGSCQMKFDKDPLLKFASLFLVFMPKFLDKDFFGDPFWPKDFGSDSNRFQDPEAPKPSSAKKTPQIQEPNENSCSSVSPHLESQDHEDLQKSFLVNQQKMLYSNFKHEQITYLEDHKKGLEFSQVDLESEEKLSECSQSEDSHYRNLIKQAELKFQKCLDEEIYKFQNIEENQSESNSSINSESEEDFEPENIQENQFHDKIVRKYELRKQKIKIEDNECKIEQEMISEIINQCINIEDNTERKRIMEHVETSIMKKLGIGEYTSIQLEKKNQKSKDIDEWRIEGPKKKKALSHKPKTHKYKILSEREKQYLVYLSTLTTTCEVARRFNISVNNICRWKKGTKRKVGAGRKIVDMELEDKVILYVKELISKGLSFTRRHIQITARQMSDDKNFKASKGWFERFYTRNIEIFNRSSSYSIK